MVYRAIGLQSDNLQNGLEIAFVELQEQAGIWSYEILQADCFAYTDQWIRRLENAGNLSAMDYLLLHSEYGHYTGQQVNKFIEQYQLHYQVALIASPGYTAFHLRSLNTSVQLGEGAAVAAATQLPVVSDFHSVDTALGGQGKKWEILKQKFPVQTTTDSTGTVINNAVLHALMGVLRWRQEYNVFADETGASRNSIGGALWTGQEA